MHTKPTETNKGTVANALLAKAWIEQEVGGCHFKDVRLAKRLSKLFVTMSGGGIDERVPYACQDWANTIAAYRFFSNDEESEERIMAGHFLATHGRLAH